MGIHTDIEWCDSSLQLEVGCAGCELWTDGYRECYAGNLVERYKGLKGWPKSFSEPELFLNRLDEASRWKDLTGQHRPNKPWLNGYPRVIFLNDLGDTFTEALPLDWMAPLLPRMATLPHVFIVLTKRANRMLRFSMEYPFPDNFWLMTSVTSSDNYHRIDQLMDCKGGSVRGISYEPALGEINLDRWLDGRLNWVVAGGMSGNSERGSDLAWFLKTQRQCVGKSAWFLKQLGNKPYRIDLYDDIRGPARKRLVLLDKKGAAPEEWPTQLNIREMPRISLDRQHSQGL